MSQFLKMTCRDTSQEAKLHVLQNEEWSNDVLGVPNRSDLEYVMFCKRSGMGNNKNTAESESKISNEDYNYNVYIPESVEKSPPDQDYDYVPTEGVRSSPEDSPKVTN